MSWSFSVTNVTPSTAQREIEFVAQQDIIPRLEPASAFESAEQVTAVVNAAIDLVTSGAFGDGPFTVRLTGHGRWSGFAREGWGPVIVTISVNQTEASPGGTS